MIGSGSLGGVMPIKFHRDGPWELPKGWAWATLRDLVSLRGEKAPPNRTSEFPFVGMDDVPANSLRIQTTGEFRSMKSAGNKFYTNDLLYGRLRPYLNKVVVANFEGVASGEFIVMCAPDGIEPRYLQLFMHGRRFVNLATADTSGDRPRIDFDKIGEIKIPLAPTSEQRRILVRIDDLFTEIAEGEASLGRVRDDLNTWRRALLKAAVTGKLTCEWRGRNNPKQSAVEYVANLSLSLQSKRSRRTPSDISIDAFGHGGSEDLPDTWTKAEISSIFDVSTGATPRRDERRYYDGGRIPWVTSSVVNSSLVLEAEQFITNAAIDETNAKIFPPGTILVAMYGEGKTRGKATELAIAAATNQACAALLRPGNETELRSYVKYWFEYNYLELRKQAAGGVQPNLNLEMIKRLRLPIPPREEMLEVVAILAADFDSFAATSYEMDTLNKSIAGLRQSVLKNAFEGHLVEQDPRDEPADQLLVRLSKQTEAPVHIRSRRPKGRRAALTAEQ
jgi:type I restriction enzyme S subunit